MERTKKRLVYACLERRWCVRVCDGQNSRKKNKIIGWTADVRGAISAVGRMDPSKRQHLPPPNPRPASASRAAAVCQWEPWTPLLVNNDVILRKCNPMFSLMYLYTYFVLRTRWCTAYFTSLFVLKNIYICHLVLKINDLTKQIKLQQSGECGTWSCSVLTAGHVQPTARLYFSKNSPVLFILLTELFSPLVS